MTNHNNKVSIIIPVYNGSNFLAEAIDSALNQTYKNKEVIVINDGSNDNGATEGIAKTYGDSIKYYHKINGGVASALNFGIQKMTGDYFSWLSHDDMYEKTKIEEEVKYLLLQPEPWRTVVACNSYALYDNGIKKKETINRGVFDDFFDIFLATSAKSGINGCSLMIPKAAIVRSIGFVVNLTVTQDYDLWYRMKDVCRFVLLEKHLVIYRHHAMQDSIKLMNESVVAGDKLRAHILKNTSKASFSKFMSADGLNEKWMWDNYSAYRSKGYVKTSLEILRALAGYYYEHDIKKTERVLNEVISIELRYGIDSPAGESTDDSSLATRVDAVIESVGNVGYKDYIIADAKTGRVRGYIESAKSDGVLFVLHKALRKLSRIIRG